MRRRPQEGGSIYLHVIAIGISPPVEVNVIIEVPICGAPIQYAIDKEADALLVDRSLYRPMRYPGNDRFIPHTVAPMAIPAKSWWPARGPLPTVP